MPPLTLEALELLAEQIRCRSVDDDRAMLDQLAWSGARRVDSAPLAAAYARTDANVPLRVLFTEALAYDSLRDAIRAYDRTWTRGPIAVRGEPAIPLRALVSVLVAEPNAARRAAIARAADTKAGDHRDAARHVVERARDFARSLGFERSASLLTALGMGELDDVARVASDVRRATDDIFRELDAWARKRTEVAARGALDMEHRVRTIAMPNATATIPHADRVGIASRWLERLGFDSELHSLGNATHAPDVAASGVRALCDAPGTHAILVGTPTRGANGTTEFVAAMCEATSMVAGNEPRVSDRLGRDRVHFAANQALGRALMATPDFLTHEAGVDPGRREAIALEALHAWLFRVRSDTALGALAIDALERTPGFATKFRDAMLGAVASAPEPAWVIHLAAQMLEVRAPSRVIGATVAATMLAQLRDHFDVDWFRNPRAGPSLRATWAGMRRDGASAYVDAKLDVQSLASFAAEAFRRARG